MDVVGSVASILAVVGAGAQLTLSIFELAATVGSAGEELQSIGTEISLFCAVLKQLQKTLTDARSCRYSIVALDTTEKILGRCKEVFDGIEAVINNLRHQRVEGVKPSTNLLSRLKWTFKERSKVMKYCATLDSCKLTLHLMVATLDFAQKVSERRISTLETKVEDDQEKVMTQGLIIAQQCAIDRLQRLEQEEYLDCPEANGETVRQTSAIDQRTGRLQDTNLRTRLRANRAPQVNNGDVVPPVPDEFNPSVRISTWLNELIYDIPDPKRQTWGGNEPSFTRTDQLARLLGKWTDQGRRWSGMNESGISEEPGSKEWDSGEVGNEVKRKEWNEGGEDSFKTHPFRVSTDLPCFKVLAVALEKYNIQGDWREYDLYISSGDQERLLGLDEKPLVIFKQLDRQGAKPLGFVIRRRATPTAWPEPVITVPSSQQDDHTLTWF